MKNENLMSISAMLKEKATLSCKETNDILRVFKLETDIRLDHLFTT